MKKRPMLFYVMAALAVAFLLHHKSSTTVHIGGPFTLIDTHNHPVRNTDFSGRVLLIGMGYSHCTDPSCQGRLASLSAALKSLGPDANSVAVLFISLDPARDTPAALAQYLAPYDPRIVGLTGTKPTLNQLLREYHVRARRQPIKGSANDYAIDYSGNFYVMDKTGKLSTLLRPDATPDDIVNAVKNALAK